MSMSYVMFYVVSTADRQTSKITNTERTNNIISPGVCKCNFKTNSW